MLSATETVMFLREIPYFRDLSREQLQLIAAICTETSFPADTAIIHQGVTGGDLYILIAGRVAIEQARRGGRFVRLATMESPAYFGEMTLFDQSPYPVSAITLEESFALKLSHAAFIALLQATPDLAMLFNRILAQLLRNANDRIAELTRPKPRELHRLYDKLI